SKSASGWASPEHWLANPSWAIRLVRMGGGSHTVNRARLVRFWPYAAAAIGILAVALALFVVFERQTALDLWSRATAYVAGKGWYVIESNWKIFLFTILLIAIEPLFLTWEKTTVFGVFVRRNFSAIADLGFAIAYLSGFRRLLEYALTFGLAYGAVKLGD